MQTHMFGDTETEHGNAATKKLRPPVKWHGGKFYLAKRIIELFPPHHTYVEPFGGAASALLNKSPSPVEVYNDLNENIVNFFRVLRNDAEALRRLLSLTPYAEQEFHDSRTPNDDPVERARRFFVQSRQSIGGRGVGWSCTLHRSRRGMTDVVSGYLSAIDDQLPLIVERLRQVQILYRPALEVIRKWDDDHTLFYCDPPYLAETRQSKAVYEHEMTEADHREFASTVNACIGMVLVSGYRCDLYDTLFREWERSEFEVANHAAGGRTKRRMTECVWRNY